MAELSGERPRSVPDLRRFIEQLELAVVKRDKKALQAASKRLEQAQSRKVANQLAAQLGAKTCASS